jgi:molybdopterin-containing oxidoreductase family membrane subunit
MLRDRAITPFNKRIYSILSFGWSGRAKDWQRFEEVSLVLAGLATPLVLLLHYCIYGFCYFCNSRMAYNNFPVLVAGLFSGFAMVNNLLIIMRKI